MTNIRPIPNPSEDTMSGKAGTTPRSYTVAEIDRMREAIRWSYPAGVVYYPDERNADIEDRLRTYMTAGISAEELEESRNEQIAQSQQHVL